MYSNCLFEAIKAKIKDPKNVHIHLIPPTLNNFRMHFYWIDLKENRFFHYCAKEGHCRLEILFNGTLREKPTILFEELLYKKMKEAKWSESKQIKTAKKLGFIRKEPFEIEREETS